MRTVLSRHNSTPSALNRPASHGVLPSILAASRPATRMPASEAEDNLPLTCSVAGGQAEASRLSIAIDAPVADGPWASDNHRS